MTNKSNDYNINQKPNRRSAGVPIPIRYLLSGQAENRPDLYLPDRSILYHNEHLNSSGVPEIQCNIICYVESAKSHHACLHGYISENEIFIKPTMPLRPKFDLKLDVGYSDYMTKEQLIDIIKRVLETDADLDFLDKLSNSELETFVAVMRDRIEHPG